MPYAADTGLVLQLLSGETPLVKVHTHHVRHTSNNMCQVSPATKVFILSKFKHGMLQGQPLSQKDHRCQNGEFGLQTVNRRDMGLFVQKTITILLVMHVFDCVADTFRPRLGMPKELPLQIHNARKALQLVEDGKKFFSCNALLNSRWCFYVKTQKLDGSYADP